MTIDIEQQTRIMRLRYEQGVQREIAAEIERLRGRDGPAEPTLSDAVSCASGSGTDAWRELMGRPDLAQSEEPGPNRATAHRHTLVNIAAWALRAIAIMDGERP